MDPTVPAPTKEYLASLAKDSLVFVYNVSRYEAAGPFPVTRVTLTFIEVVVHGDALRFERTFGTRRETSARGGTRVLLAPEVWEQVLAERAERAAFYRTLKPGDAVLVERVASRDAPSVWPAQAGVVERASGACLMAKVLRDTRLESVWLDGVPRSMAHGREWPYQLLPAEGKRYERALCEVYAQRIARLGAEKLADLPLNTLESFWADCEAK
jgi:hypothetical protein